MSVGTDIIFSLLGDVLAETNVATLEPSLSVPSLPQSAGSEQDILNVPPPSSISQPQLFLDPYLAFLGSVQQTTAPVIAEEIRKSKGEQPPLRKAVLPEAVKSLRKQRGWRAIATEPNYIFTPSLMSNAIVKASLQEMFNAPSLVHVIYNDMGFKLLDEFQRDRKVQTHINHINATLALHKPDFRLNENTFDDFLASLNILEQDHDFCMTHAIQENILQLRNLAALSYEKALHSNARCFVFLPCLVKYKTGKESIVTLVGISGDEDNANRIVLDQEMGSFLNSLVLNVEGEDISFRYVDKVSLNFNDLYLKLNEEINPFGESSVKPQCEGRHCGEKKVYSELVKHLLGKDEEGIESIEILGETNIHTPTLSQWHSPVESSLVERERVESLSERERAIQYHEQLKIENPLYLNFIRNINEILSAFEDSFQSLSPEQQAHIAHHGDIIKREAEVLKQITGRENPTLINASFTRLKSNLHAAKEKCIRNFGIVLNIPEVIRFGKITNVLSSAKEHIESKIASDSFGDYTATGFYVESLFSPSNPDNATPRYFPIHYRDACESCQTLKPAYLGAMMYADHTSLPSPASSSPASSSSPSPAASSSPSPAASSSPSPAASSSPFVPAFQRFALPPSPMRCSMKEDQSFLTSTQTMGATCSSR